MLDESVLVAATAAMDVDGETWDCLEVDADVGSASSDTSCVCVMIGTESGSAVVVGDGSNEAATAAYERRIDGTLRCEVRRFAFKGESPTLGSAGLESAFFFCPAPASEYLIGRIGESAPFGSKAALSAVRVGHCGEGSGRLVGDRGMVN